MGRGHQSTSDLKDGYQQINLRSKGTSSHVRTEESVNLSLRARLRSGESDAFAEIFDEHSQAIFRHAMRVTGERPVAEDVVSLTFLEAWRLRHKIQPEGESLAPWLFGIATNVIRNTTRAARRHRALLTRVAPHDTVPDFSTELVDRIADAQQMVYVREALNSLRCPEREVFTLVVWAGLDYEAAAEALGIAVGTVRSRLSRTRTKLRNYVQSRELETHSGQVTGSRDTAARSVQETIR